MQLFGSEMVLALQLANNFGKVSFGNFAKTVGDLFWFGDGGFWLRFASPNTKLNVKSSLVIHKIDTPSLLVRL